MKVAVVGAVSAGVGISLGTFISEAVTRLTGQTGWAKFGIKALVKVMVSVLLYTISGKLSGLLSFGLEIASYGMAGSIIPDVFDAAIPGGLVGGAETVAVSIRAMGRQVPTTQAGQKAAEEKAIAAVSPF